MWPSDRPILVTGAGGFIGGRVVEVLHGMGIPVRASVRRWCSAARIGRLPVEIVLCDITDAGQVRKAMDGVGGVVHCAYGDRRTTVEGTKTVLQAALEAGVARVVHLSTMDVYGDVEGDILEDAPLRENGSQYRDAKIAAELLCRSYMERGLPVSILRPTIVYGPFSTAYTAGFAERLVARGRFPSREDCQGTCNLLYIDDLVAAIVLALSRKEAVGEAFNVNGEERLTWWQYLNDLSQAIHLPPLNGGRPSVQRLRFAVLAPVRTLARKILDRFEAPIRALYKRSPVARRLMQKAEQVIRRLPSAGESRLFKRKVYLRVDKARAVLGYRSQFPASSGIALSASWLRHHAFLGVPEEARWND